VTFAAGLPFPDFERTYEYVSLRHASDYPMNEGRLVSNTGLDIAVREYDQHFEEQHVAHSNALHSVHTGKGSYLVGPLARYNLNFDRLSPVAQQAAKAAGLGPACHNPFKSNIVRAVETVYACDEALRIIDRYDKPAEAMAEFRPSPGVGYACTEAPRGILFHRYRINPRGLVLDAKIVPPTSQNQKSIEDDLAEFVPGQLALPHAELTRRCEQTVRNHDPCISCATHFLTVKVEEA
jgi:sulfhydrogenase subunit alpha